MTGDYFLYKIIGDDMLSHKYETKTRTYLLISISNYI